MNQGNVRVLQALQVRLERFETDVEINDVEVPTGSPPSNYYDVQHVAHVAQAKYVSELAEMLLNVIDVLLTDGEE